MNFVSCPQCGLVYDLNNVDLPNEDQIDHATHHGHTDGVCMWHEGRYIPVFVCHCGNEVGVVND